MEEETDLKECHLQQNRPTQRSKCKLNSRTAGGENSIKSEMFAKRVAYLIGKGAQRRVGEEEKRESTSGERRAARGGRPAKLCVSCYVSGTIK